MLESLMKQVQEKMTVRKSATVFGVEFTFTLLSVEDDQKVTEYRATANREVASQEDFLAIYSDIMKRTLSYAIRAIEGKEIPEVIKREDGGTTSRSLYLREFLETLPKKAVESLFDVFTDFKKEIDSRIDKELVYDWFETPEEREKRFEEEGEEAGEQKSPESASGEGSTEKDRGVLKEGDVEFKVIKEEETEEEKPEDASQVQ